MWKIVHFPVGQLHALVHREQSCSFTCLSGKPKSAMSEERVLHPFLSLAILVALVVLVFGDQLVQLWVAGLLRDTAGDSLLDPP